MNVKELIFGGGVKDNTGSGTYRDSIQAWLPIKNIIGGIVVTKDNRFIKILEVLPVNIYLKSANDRQNIISAYAAYLKIAPDSLQLEARTLPADTAEYVERMRQYAEREENTACREMIEDNIREGNRYEDNMEIWENDVQIVTSLVGDTMSQYIYYEIRGIQESRQQYQDFFVNMIRFSIIAFTLILVLFLFLSCAIIPGSEAAA